MTRAPAPPAGLLARHVVIGEEEFVVLSWPDGTAATALDAPTLSAAERAVGALLLAGRSDAEIAVLRCVSPRTIGKQVASIYRKLDVRSRRELWARARPAKPAPR